MNAQANEKKVLRLLDEAWNGGNLDVLDELVASDAVPSNQDGPPGPHTWKQDISYYRGSFSDLTYTVDDLISAGDKVVARWTARGTDSIGFMGMPPSDMSVTFTGVTIYRFVDGKIVEHWAEFDLAGLLHRLGVATIRRDMGTA